MNISYKLVNDKYKIVELTNLETNFIVHVIKINGFICVDDIISNINELQRFITIFTDIVKKNDIKEYFDFVNIDEKEVKKYYGCYLSPLLIIKVILKLCPEKINDILTIFRYILHDDSFEINKDGIIEMLKYFNENRDMLMIINYHQEQQKNINLMKSFYRLLILYIINLLIMLFMYLS